MGWFKNITQSITDNFNKGLEKSSNAITSSIKEIFVKKYLDEEVLADLEDILLQTDMGTQMCDEIIEHLRKNKFDEQINQQQLLQEIANKIMESIKDAGRDILAQSQDNKSVPYSIMMVGVNGSGKTTSIGKMAAHCRGQGRDVTIAACDTFRAAAIEQLEEWATRANCKIVKGAHKSDAAALAYKAYEQAQDILIIDTAGRLHNKAHLMDELVKIKRVVQKHNDQAPDDIFLVIDGTTGQNALIQVEQFHEKLGLSGIIITKLDGTSKGGIVINIIRKFNLPIIAIGVGEKLEDLQPFDAQLYLNSMLNI